MTDQKVEKYVLKFNILNDMNNLKTNMLLIRKMKKT